MEMLKPKLVVIGNGMAGIRAVEELLKLAPDAYDITVFGAEPHPNYNRILLSPVLSGEQTLDQIMLNDCDWYAANGDHGQRHRRPIRQVAARDRFGSGHPAHPRQGPSRGHHVS